MASSDSAHRRIFAIMPFVHAGARTQQHLTRFFENNIKNPIESTEFKHPYRVYRSGESFDITAEIIRDLCRADIVIADLSGVEPNSNVMYELGVRLAISERPVILIREETPENRRIFDIYGFYTHPYDPYDYAALTQHLIEKIRRLESGEEIFVNPVLSLIRDEMTRLNPDLTDVPPERQQELVLRGVRAVGRNVERAVGPYGAGVGVNLTSGETVVERKGRAIAESVQSGNPFEAQGVRLLTTASAAVAREVGDGTKLPVILAHAMIEAGLDVLARKIPSRDLLTGMSSAVRAVCAGLRENALPSSGLLQSVQSTAAKAPLLGLDVASAFQDAGPNGLVTVDIVGLGESSVETEGTVVDSGAVRPEFLVDGGAENRVLQDCFVLLYPGKIDSMREVLGLLEQVAQTRKPLLILAGDVVGEALATLIVNTQRGVLECVPVRVPGAGERNRDLLEDLAVLTGGTVLNPELGYRLTNAVLSDLGRAERVVVSRHSTEITGGAGDASAIAARVRQLRALQKELEEYDAERVLLRIARLAGKIVTLRVGATTEDELRDRRYAVESALHSIAAAEATGAVPGGGAALLHARRFLNAVSTSNEGESAGIAVVATALETPMASLISTIGLDPAPIIAEIAATDDPRIGYNLASRRVEDLVTAGILDPVRVLTRGIEVALGSASTFLGAASWQV